MSERSMPFRPGDDAARAAVAPLLDELRGELLVLPREPVVEKHLGMMAFEQRVLSAPQVERPVRRVRNRPRRTAFVFGCIAATIASCGLSAAGALPEPLQQITDTIAHTLGVPQPHDDGTSTGTAPTTEPEATTPSTEHDSSASNPKPDTAPDAGQPEHRKPRVTTTTEPSVTTTPTSTPPAEPEDPTFPPRPNEPGGRIDPNTPTTEPPSDNSQNTPAGYPSDWREQAMNSAAIRLLVCSVTDSLAPAGCPQSAVAAGAQNVTWRILGDPATTAAAVATTTTNAAGEPSTLVTVYDRFRMVATYTRPETGDRQYTAYSSGIAEATMIWNGTFFDHVTMKTGSVEGHVMPGVVVPTFSRPPLWDAMVAMKVQGAFERCTASGPPDASCPAGGLLDSPTTNESTLNGNVVSAAEVSFDGTTGLYTVTGTYSLTPPSGTAVNGVYTATFFWDNPYLTILSVTGR